MTISVMRALNYALMPAWLLTVISCTSVDSVHIPQAPLFDSNGYPTVPPSREVAKSDYNQPDTHPNRIARTKPYVINYRPQDLLLDRDPRSTNPVSMAIIEFDDQGMLRDERQLLDTQNFLLQRNPEEPLFLLFFAHGFNNDAAPNSNDINQFRNLLIQLRTNKGVNREILGVYLGWRGTTIRRSPMAESIDSLPRKFGRKFAKVSEQIVHIPFNFGSRKQTAEKVGGISCTEALLGISAIAKKPIRLDRNDEEIYADASKAPDVTIIAAGHSLGAVVMEKAFLQPMLGYELMHAPAEEQIHEEITARKKSRSDKQKGLEKAVIAWESDEHVKSLFPPDLAPEWESEQNLIRPAITTNDHRKYFTQLYNRPDIGNLPKKRREIKARIESLNPQANDSQQAMIAAKIDYSKTVKDCSLQLSNTIKSLNNFRQNNKNAAPNFKSFVDGSDSEDGLNQLLASLSTKLLHFRISGQPEDLRNGINEITLAQKNIDEHLKECLAVDARETISPDPVDSGPGTSSGPRFIRPIAKEIENLRKLDETDPLVGHIESLVTLLEKLKQPSAPDSPINTDYQLFVDHGKNLVGQRKQLQDENSKLQTAEDDLDRAEDRLMTLSQGLITLENDINFLDNLERVLNAVQQDSPADLVFLLNPASSAIATQQWSDRFLEARPRSKFQRANNSNRKTTYVISVTGKNDATTRAVLPVFTKIDSSRCPLVKPIRWLFNINHSGQMTRKFNSGASKHESTLDGYSSTSYSRRRQRDLYTSTAPHTDHLVTHTVTINENDNFELHEHNDNPNFWIIEDKSGSIKNHGIFNEESIKMALFLIGERGLFKSPE